MARGSGARLASTTPTTIARISALIPGSSGATSIEATATPSASASPGTIEGEGVCDVEGSAEEPGDRVREGAEDMAFTLPPALTRR